VRQKGRLRRPRRLRHRLIAALVAGVALVLLSGLVAVGANTDGFSGFGLDSDAEHAAGTDAATHLRAGGGAANRDPSRSARATPAPAPTPTAVVTLGSGPRTPVPRSYLGISTEYWALPVFERQMPVLERTLSLLHAPDDGPMILRVGGDSADHSFWAPKSRPMPAWAFELTPAWLQRTDELVQTLNLRLILDLNLVTDTPHAAAAWAQAAETQLPPGSISGFEIGNEPDIYNHSFWMTTVAHSKVVPPLGLTPHSYAHDFQTYARALKKVAPGVPLIGPALALPYYSRHWISTLLASRPAHPAVISVHRYPYSGCALPGTPAYATIGHVLGENASAGVARSVEPAVALARRAGDPVRLTELNSVTCGGRPGVSNAFATALWAPDALFELMRAGVSGVNIHVRARAVNAAFEINSAGLDARPLLYGMLTFVRALGPGAELVPLNLGVSPALHFKAWGVSVRGGALHVLLIDKGQRPVDVSLRLPAIGYATVERLLAPSASARSGVTLAGQYLGVDGSWEGRTTAERLRPSADGSYSVAVPRYSAALVTLQLRSGALGGAPSRGRDHRSVVAERTPVVVEPTRRRAPARLRRHRSPR
jgi:Glycosyl hydrolase family 79 C-terminal beta domain